MIFIKGREIPAPVFSAEEQKALLNGETVALELNTVEIGDRFTIEGKPVFCKYVSRKKSKFRLMEPEEYRYSTEGSE